MIFPIHMRALSISQPTWQMPLKTDQRMISLISKSAKRLVLAIGANITWLARAEVFRNRTFNRLGKLDPWHSRASILRHTWPCGRGV